MIVECNCPSCGAPVERKYGESVVCDYCGAVVYPSEEERSAILEREKERLRLETERRIAEEKSKTEKYRVQLEKQRLDFLMASAPKPPHKTKKPPSASEWISAVSLVLMLISVVLAALGFHLVRPATFARGFVLFLISVGGLYVSGSFHK